MLVKSKTKKDRDRKRCEREEQRWKRKNGPVKSYIDPSIIKRSAASEDEEQ